MKHTPTPFRLPQRASQRGAVLLMSLIVLVVLLISAVALVRSFDTSLFQSGNIAFKRDLVNQGERVVPTVLTAFDTGALSTAEARGGHLPASNYSATILPSNAQGVPVTLLDAGSFDGSYGSGNNIVVSGQGVTIRYVIDRMCSTTGLDAALGAGSCILADAGAPMGGTNYRPKAELPGTGGAAGAMPQQVVYRISIRVDGPRNTQAFLQTTFSPPPL
jgi:type IV pilus assembly protein PilX